MKHWELVNKKMILPLGKEFLCVDRDNNYKVGPLFTEENSPTGYVCYTSDDEQIDVIAIKELPDDSDWNSLVDQAPSAEDVLVKTTSERILVGTISNGKAHNNNGIYDIDSWCAFTRMAA